MAHSRLQKDLSKLLNELVEIPLKCETGDEGLRRLTELCRQAMASRACTLVWIDLERKLLTQVAGAGFDRVFEAFMAKNKIRDRSST